MRDRFIARDGDTTSQRARLGSVDLEGLMGGLVDKLEEGHKEKGERKSSLRRAVAVDIFYDGAAAIISGLKRFISGASLLFKGIKAGAKIGFCLGIGN